MTPDEIILQRQQLEATLNSKGWQNILAPAFRRRIEEIEKAICDADADLPHEETVALRRERQHLKWIIETPDRLIESLSINARNQHRARASSN